MRRDSRSRSAKRASNPTHGERVAISHRRYAIRTDIGTLPVVALVILLLAWYAFANWLPKPPKPDATWTRIVQETVFRIGIDPSFPPFEADDGKGNLSGFDLALAHELVRDWSRENQTIITVEYAYTGYDGLYDALKAGQFDAILSALPYDPKKTEDVRFSHSYYNGGPLLVVRENNVTTKWYTDLASQRVGVELGSSGDSFARRWQRRLKYDLREYNTAADALRALTSKQVEGVFTDGITLNDFLRDEGGVKTIGKPLTDELIVIAVRKATPTLLDHINAVIDAMKRDGRMEMLMRDWF